MQRLLPNQSKPTRCAAAYTKQRHNYYQAYPFTKMLILLPPSETKITTLPGTMATPAAALTEAIVRLNLPLLATPDPTVLTALQKLCQDPETAAKPLKLSPGPKAQAACASNLAVANPATPKIPASLCYTGVLYDALAVAQLPAAALSWLAANAAVQSALYGIVFAGQQIANYRLAASASLPQLKGSLKAHWGKHYRNYPWQHHGFVLDLRSNDYAALAPLNGYQNQVQLVIRTRDKDGKLKNLNHFNKQAKGDLVWRLALAQAEISDSRDFTSWARASGLEILDTDHPNRLELITDLGSPGR